ncbi:MAG: PAS domain S-box protein [Planctomycetota bacterium]|nr:PAS domain S-box protein [Planctomycetota bacterium]
MEPYTLINAGLFGLFSFAAIFYFFNWFHSRSERLLLAFGALCTFCALFCPWPVLIAHATSLPAAQLGFDMRISIGAFAHASALAFFGIAAGHQKKWPLRAAVIWLVLVGSIYPFFPLRCKVIGLTPVELPLGGAGVAPMTEAAWSLSFFHACALAVYAYGVWTATTLFKRDPVGAVIFGIAAMACLLGIATGVLVDVIRLPAPYVGAIPHSIFALLMAVYLSREYAARGEKVRASELRFSNAFEYAPIGKALIAPDGRWLRVNRAFCQMTGYSAEELCARTLQDITHPADLPHDLEQKQRLLAGEIDVFQVEKRYVHKDGRVVWGDQSVCLIRDGLGKPAHFISQIQNITERKRVAAELLASHEQVRKSEQTLQIALESAGLGVFELGAGASDFQGDERALGIFGLSGRPDGKVPVDLWKAMLHPDDRPAAVAAMEGLFAGTPRALAEYRITRPDGTQRHVEAHAMVLKREDGSPAQIVGLVADITERKGASLEREKLLVDLGERVKELRMLHAAARMLQNTGVPLQAILDEMASAIAGSYMHADCCEARIEYGDLTAKTKGWKDSPWRMVETFTADGRTGTIEVVYTEERPERAEGPFLSEERALLGSLSEMLKTFVERVAAEERRRQTERNLQQTQKMEALGTLAGGIAHDFNNILTAVLGNVHMARKRLPKDQPAYPFLEKIQAAGERARDLIKRILQFSRKQEPRRENIQVSSVVEDVGMLLRASLPKAIQIETACAENIPAVHADAVQIHQVIMNLGVNAGYSMKQGGGKLAMSVDLEHVAGPAAPCPNLTPGEYVRITVRDSGTGMSPEVQRRLFEPFFTTKGNEGTGLGLSVVHGIVRDHGGGIAVESELGRGTAFRVYLPAATGAVPEARPEAKAPEVAVGVGQTIMYVDDDLALLPVTVRMLQMLGYRCAGFYAPSEALEAFRASPARFDAVITDFNMPGMTGIELSRAMRALRPELPVALLTGSLEGGTALDERGVTLLHKPATLDQLGLALNRMLPSSPPAPDVPLKGTTE